MDLQTTFQTNTVDETKKLASQIGQNLRGGEFFELVSDLGGGKTTFAAGLVRGLGIDDPVTSPSFTIMNNYKNDQLNVYHFDFYRLDDPGIVTMQLQEVLDDDKAITLVEWGGVVEASLPKKRVLVEIKVSTDTSRQIKISLPRELNYLLEFSS